jgi:hypothetical protein
MKSISSLMGSMIFMSTEFIANFVEEAISIVLKILLRIFNNFLDSFWKISL